jgi:hypothetical protein
MKLTGHKTEAVYRRYAIVSKADLTQGVKKLNSCREGESNPHGLAPTRRLRVYAASMAVSRCTIQVSREPHEKGDTYTSPVRASARE